MSDQTLPTPEGNEAAPLTKREREEIARFAGSRLQTRPMAWACRAISRYEATIRELESGLSSQETATAATEAGTTTRMFPIQDGPDIPWSAISPFEKQALKNHRQTLTRLAERGGLGVGEAIGVLRCLPYGSGDHYRLPLREQILLLQGLTAPASRASVPEAEADEFEESAERTVASIAAMLGWGYVPWRHILEADIRALKARAVVSGEDGERLADALADRQALIEGKVRCRLSGFFEGCWVAEGVVDNTGDYLDYATADEALAAYRASSPRGEPAEPTAHPEDTCERCGRPNARWFAPSPLWNDAVRAPQGKDYKDWIICPICFIELAGKVGISPPSWRVAPCDYTGPDHDPRISRGEPAASAPDTGGVGVVEACEFLTGARAAHAGLTPGDLRGLCGLVEGEAGRFERSHPPTAAHWARIAGILRAALGEV